MSLNSHTVRDQVSFACNPARFRIPAFQVINRLDGEYTPGEQLLGAAIAVVAMAEAVGIAPHELITRAITAMKQVDGPHTYHIRAIREYAAGEILRRD